MAKIDINTLKTFCEGGTGIEDMLESVYPENIRHNMKLWEQGYEAAMNSVLHFIALMEQHENSDD